MLRVSICAAALAIAMTGAANAQQPNNEPIKIGLIQSLTGPFNMVGKAAVDGARLYVQQHGDTVAGRKIELLIKDDGTAPDRAKRIAQELIVNDKVAIIGAGITPSSLTIAPLVTEAKIATVVMVSGASITVERSPYMVRVSFTLGQSSDVMAGWLAQNGARKIVTLVNDWAPGIESETVFKDRIAKSDAKIADSLRMPLANPDFAPFLQRARDLAPDSLFVFPANQSGIFAKQFLERGMDKSGIRLVGTGDLTDDDELPSMTDAALGIVTAHHYSALHDSALNKSFVAAFEKAYGRRPNYHAVAGYDGMHLIYEALEKTGGKTDGDALIAAMKGMSWESPRGPISVDPQTRDIVQNEYIRKVERRGGQLYNVEFATVEAVKDPMKAAKK
ncbi:MAG: ABC transporter substrate-binding protein [Alphaproteobacteria bacterium]|nr:ABC transporter substrate-binding protein [Alphaproteobacteria bacterium]